MPIYEVTAYWQPEDRDTGQNWSVFVEAPTREDAISWASDMPWVGFEAEVADPEDVRLATRIHRPKTIKGRTNDRSNQDRL